ncbi:transposase [Roseomonas sp. GC11]|uniref:transposase n=1 Tax=Roseomonas sp. GC11 TaxID=2950546 RepID=UPI00210C1C2C|nr:transposase [Roseomonas sp. GC11]
MVYAELKRIQARQGVLWPTSYFAASCGGAPLAMIHKYFEDQRVPGERPLGLTPA